MTTQTFRLMGNLLNKPRVYLSSVVIAAGALGLVSGAAVAQEKTYSYEVVNKFPHDIEAFTQGLVFRGGKLYEGTGKKGKSTLSRIDLETGTVEKTTPLSSRHFGEGIEVVGDKIYQLTWQSNIVFVYDKESFEQLDSHYNPTEGWGVTFDGSSLIISDGSPILYFYDPITFQPRRRVQVMYSDTAVPNLNELEFINGEVWANVWQTDYIVRINPETGRVNSLVDLSGLSEQTTQGSNEALLNGIAWDADGQRLLVTGKHWSDIFEIELVEQ